MAVDPDQILNAFAVRRDDYEALAAQIASLLKAALAELGIRYLIIESRAKTIDSLQQKLSRPGKNYNAVSEVPDLAGVRVVAFYQDDCFKIADLIKNEFSVVEEELSHQQDRLGSDKFGYISAHYVVKCSDTRRKLLEWKRISDLQCEVQIRTVIQHAWSAVSHELQYKVDEVPARLERRLNRISGLFELADEEFVELRKQKQKISEETEQALKSKRMDVPLNSTGAARYSERWLAQVGGAAELEKIGYNLTDNYESEAAGQLVRVARLSGIRTLRELSRTAGNFDRDYLKRQYESDGRSGHWTVSPSFVLLLQLLRAPEVQVTSDHLVELGWGKEIADRVLHIAKSS